MASTCGERVIILVAFQRTLDKLAMPKGHGDEKKSMRRPGRGRGRK